MNLSYSLSFFVGPLLHALKLWVGGGGGGLRDFSVSPRPLGFGFLGLKGLGLRVWGQGLTIQEYGSQVISNHFTT